MDDSHLHIMVVLEPRQAAVLDWQHIREEAVKRKAVLSLLEITGTAAKWLVPAAQAATTVSSVSIAAGTGAAEPGSGTTIIDKLFEAQALVSTIYETEVRLIAGDLVESELADALEPETTVHLKAYDRGVLRAGRSVAVGSRSIAGCPTRATTPVSAATAIAASPAPPMGTRKPQGAVATRVHGPSTLIKRRTNWQLVAAIVAVVVVASGAWVFIATRPQAPEASVPGQADPESSLTNPAAGSEGTPSAGRQVEPVAARLQPGSDSRYSADYAATVTAVSQDGLQVHVDFTASGRSDLRRPETSCLAIEGADGAYYLARPTAISLSTDSPGAFSGRMSFPALVSGSYGLRYSCATDYTIAALGTVDVPSVGVSRYSEEYYVAVLGFDEHDVEFAAHGRSDLRSPETSCARLGDQLLSPTVSLQKEEIGQGILLVGRMSFPKAIIGSAFVYSCADYSEVPLS